MDRLREAWFSIWFYFETRWSYPTGLERAKYAIRGIIDVLGEADELLRAVLLAFRAWFQSRLAQQNLAKGLSARRFGWQRGTRMKSRCIFPFLAQGIESPRSGGLDLELAAIRAKHSQVSTRFRLSRCQWTF